jgi:hypothetical protein
MTGLLIHFRNNAVRLGVESHPRPAERDWNYF